MEQNFDALKKQLLMTRKNLAVGLSEGDVAKADGYCDGYKAFLDQAKTEREAVRYAENAARQAGFVPFAYGKQYAPNDKVYFVNRNKAIIFAVIGEKPLTEGVHITAAHIDSPRIDLKPNPVYEDGELAYFKTHYYGGIKKYQWTVMPLALHGRIIKKDGSAVDVCIGEEESDPVFCITDLLPHLADEQMKRTLAQGIKGEELNVVIGSRPLGEAKAKEDELVKLHVLRLLNEKYGIVEADFLSAELTLVPAHKAKDVGLDRSLVGAYGHDDRVCAYPALTAILACDRPKHTAVTVLTDKEEIGSDGNTGLNSAYLKDFITALSDVAGVPPYVVFANSECLSADVNAALDPTWPDVSEPRNSSYVNYGVVVTKYTGARGKSGTSDASAEFMGKVRRLFDENDIKWQIGELGKVDAGGGGTVAMFIASLNVDVVDVGVPVLSMHAPFELVSKLDVYMAHQAFHVFFQA